MISIALIAFAALLAFLAAHLALSSRRTEDPGAAGAAYTIMALALLMAVYAIVRALR